MAQAQMQELKSLCRMESVFISRGTIEENTGGYPVFNLDPKLGNKRIVGTRIFASTKAKGYE